MTTTHSSLVPWPCHISILVAAMDDDFLCIQQEWRKRHIMPQVQWEDSLHFISTLKVSLCSRTEKFRYGQWAFQNTCLDSKKWMIVGVPYHPVKEWGRAFPILSSPFQSNLSRQKSANVECAIEIHHVWRLFPMSSSLHIGGFRKASQRAVEEAVFAADVGPLAKLAREKITKNHY